MGGIFISYRRDDSRGYAGRLRDTLSDHFGAEQVFRAERRKALANLDGDPNRVSEVHASTSPGVWMAGLSHPRNGARCAG